MVAAARAEDVDIVGGPVLPRFPEDAPPALTAHPIYWPAYSDAAGACRMIYGSGNFLIRRRAYAKLADPDFDLRYNFLGGGDTEFFTRCRRAGLSFYWAQDARVDEIVPPERLRPGWMIQRGLRIGAINYHVDRSAAVSWLGRLRPIGQERGDRPGLDRSRARLAFAGKPPLVAVHPIDHRLRAHSRRVRDRARAVSKPGEARRAHERRPRPRHGSPPRIAPRPDVRPRSWRSSHSP